MHDGFSTFIDERGRSLVIDVVLLDGQSAAEAAEWLASTPAARGKVRWHVEKEHGPGGGWPIIRFNAIESIDDWTARNALFGIYQRWNGVNVGRNAGKPPVGRGQKRV